MPPHLNTFIVALIIIGTYANAENCIDFGVKTPWLQSRHFAYDGYAVLLKCPLGITENLSCSLPVHRSCNLTWFLNGSTQITTEEHSRISMQGYSLTFFPAVPADSGTYTCEIRNSTYCSRLNVSLTVSPALEYKTCSPFSDVSVIDTPEIPCQAAKDFLTIDRQLQISWYKDCKPLQISEGNYVLQPHALFILRLTREDAGNYTCLVALRNEGRTYNSSSSTQLYIIADTQENKPPQIIYPVNATLEAAVGSKINISCKAFIGYVRGSSEVLQYWLVDNTFIEYYNFSQLEEVKIREENNTIETALIISSVTPNLYGIEFQCVVINALAKAIGFLYLKPPEPSLLAHLLVGLAIFFFCAVSLVLTYSYFKIDIVLCYRASCHVNKPSTDGKLYDAYVLYPKAENKSAPTKADFFALEILPHILEGKCGYKLFIFGRDEPAGSAAVEIVESTIRQSRRLIFILTPDGFMDEQATMTFEHHIGLYNALVTEMKVILIELEKLKDFATFPESIKHLRKKQGTITWTGDLAMKSQMSNSCFWKKVRYNMPPTTLNTSELLSLV
ncbi:interleukin-1 receptor type 1-like [Protopterus annectens]|uniref:interleukin-1 receptor type 1-like n=1 Tax=Protopterus annectens TaxID=7888 RepID=UPI001CFB8783|nr:interleukin-1 receptor type 1-like [Protopterus annectens]